MGGLECSKPPIVVIETPKLHHKRPRVEQTIAAPALAQSLHQVERIGSVTPAIADGGSADLLRVAAELLRRTLSRAEIG